MQNTRTHLRLNRLCHILEESSFNFRYVGLCDLDTPREKWLNYLKTVETLPDLDLHCLPITLSGVSRQQWVNKAAFTISSNMLSELTTIFQSCQKFASEILWDIYPTWDEWLTSYLKLQADVLQRHQRAHFSGPDGHKTAVNSKKHSSRGQATGRLGRNSRSRGLKVALGSPEGDKKLRPSFLQLLKKLVLVQNKLFVGRNPVKIEQTCKGKNLLKNVVRCIRNATEWKSDVI